MERVYNKMEQDAVVDDLVFVAKENNVVSEQVLRILVQAAPGTAGVGEYIHPFIQWNLPYNARTGPPTKGQPLYKGH